MTCIEIQRRQHVAGTAGYQAVRIVQVALRSPTVSVIYGFATHKKFLEMAKSSKSTPLLITRYFRPLIKRRQNAQTRAQPRYNSQAITDLSYPPS